MEARGWVTRSRFTEPRDIEDKIMENNEAEQKRERIMEHENRLRELSDSMTFISEEFQKKERERKGGRRFI